MAVRGTVRASYEVHVLFRLLAKDIQSVTGKNLQFISEMSGLNPWTVPNGRVAGEVLEVPLPADGESQIFVLFSANLLWKKTSRD